MTGIEKRLTGRLSLFLYSSGKVLALAWFYICHPSWVSARIIMRLLRLTVRQVAADYTNYTAPVKTHDYYTVDFKLRKYFPFRFWPVLSGAYESGIII